MTIDFPALAEKLLADAPALLRQWLPAGKQSGREYKCGSVRGEGGESLSVNIDKGIWKDFSSGDGGADLISLYAAIHGIKQSEAAKSLGNGHDYTAEDSYTIGHECHPLPRHKHGKPVAVYEYINTSGQLLGYVCRFEPLNEKKQFSPLTCWRNADGALKWKWKKWPTASPLYHADRLAADLAAKVLIVEGEKTADAAQLLLPDWIITTWPGGAGAVKQADWSALLTRYCWCWPDNDDEGRKAADALKKILPDLHIVALRDDLPQAWDLGDAEAGFDVLPFLELKIPEIIPPKQLSTTEKQTITTCLEKINEQYAVILRGSQVLIMRHWIGEDGNGKLIFLNKRDFLLLQENNRVYVEDEDGKKKPIAIGKRWLEWDKRLGFEEVYFEPAGKEYASRYNLWRGFAVEPNEGGSHDLFLAHVKDNICQGNQEYYNWIIAWLADLFQKPARKLGTALVLRGPMRIGKGAFASHIGQLLGIHFMPITQSAQLTGKFNGHMADKLLMFVDEGWWSDERYGEGILRALITEREVTIEMKNRDAITLPNFTRFIIAANADWVVPLGMGDEDRFVILDVGIGNQRDKPYFNAIQEQLTNIHIDKKGHRHIINKSLPENAGYQSLLHYFLNYQYDESLPGHVIKTPAMAENKIYSMPDELKWWHECLIREEIDGFTLSNNQNNDILCTDFYDKYIKWCEQMKVRPISSNIIPKKFNNVILFNRSRKLSGDTYKWHYFLQYLDDLRLHFEQFLGHKIDWDEG